MPSPITTERTTTIASGLVTIEMIDAANTATDAAFTGPNGKRIAKLLEVLLLDVSEAAKTLLNIFFRRVALVRRNNFVRLFFKHVDDEFVDGLVSGSVGTLLHFFEQFTFDLNFV
jgi:hypothetical protein